jgi:hypothetical protein
MIRVRKDLEDCALRALEIQAELALLTEELDGIKALFREAGSQTYDTVKVQVRPSMRFDPDLASKVLTAETLGRIAVWRPDSKLAKEFLSPADYASCQREIGSAVIIK